MDRLRLAFVSFGFLGLSPFAPGTAGTLGGVLLAWLLGLTDAFLLASLVTCAVLYVASRPLGGWAEARAGKKDPGFFVVDEVIGYLVTILWVGAPSPFVLVLGFFVFRFFDVVKPPPARRLEALGGGDGILLDDVVAGLYGFALLALGRLVFPELPWAGS